MAGDVAKRLWGPTALNGSAATQYTVPGATTTVLTLLLATNTTGADRQLTVSIGADAAGTRIVSSLIVPANDILPIGLWVPLAAAEIIQAWSSLSGGINLTGCGVETS